uniref:Uncharacterized protein n=1 Tax=Sparus aurata TaxID=8175 RepID=A0A671WVI2_SPAAU
MNRHTRRYQCRRLGKSMFKSGLYNSPQHTCLTEKGTLIHCLWECSQILVFWENVVKCLSRTDYLLLLPYEPWFE